MSEEQILDSILNPSAEIAPRYTPWLIETDDGKSRSGVLITERGNNQTYADTNGEYFSFDFDKIVDRVALEKSIMPEQLLDNLTNEEILDLLAYLRSRSK